MNVRLLKPINLKEKMFKKGSHTFPQLQIDDKTNIERTGAILRFLANSNPEKKLYCQNQEVIDELLDLLWELNHSLAVLTLNTYGLIGEVDKNVKKRAIQDAQEQLKGLDSLLGQSLDLNISDFLLVATLQKVYDPDLKKNAKKLGNVKKRIEFLKKNKDFAKLF